MTIDSHPLTENLALRIGLACRELAPLTPQALMIKLQTLFGGRLPDQEGIKSITPCQLRPLLQQEYPDLTGKQIKAAVHWLTTWQPDEATWTEGSENIAPEPPPGVIRVAMASMGNGRLDGHFASCTHFLINDVTPTQVRWVANRLVPMTTTSDDNVATRLPLIQDSRILVVTNIGGPAVARLTRAGLLPIKVTDGLSASVWLENLQQVLAKTPPPWLQRSLTKTTS